MNIIKNKDLKRRILELSHKYSLSHLGSCLTAVDIIDEIYKKKQSDDPFILSSGHAGLALYVVIEKYEKKDAEAIYNHHGVHPDRCKDCNLYCSTGSLGHGLSIAVGMALADRTRDVWCLVSDGELTEGSIYEGYNVMDKYDINNLHVYVNHNGYGAYDMTRETPSMFLHRFEQHYTSNELPFLEGQSAHYKVMNDAEYKLGMDILS